MPRRLVVNADDFGYFDAVSRGILAAVDAGRVTATGVMANGPAFDRQAAALRARPELDVGVHLNLTLGTPLSAALGRCLAGGGGRLPRPGRLVAGLVSGLVPLAAVAAELRAQVERCLEAGLSLRFVNGHEHVHALPGLAQRVRALARVYRIPFVRVLRAEWRGMPGQGLRAVVRGGLLAGLGCLQGRDARQPVLLGSGVSGRLDLAALTARLDALAPGGAYELMCHPGYRDPAEAGDPALLRFHRWEAELALLTGPEFAAACARAGVILVRFRDLAPAAGVSGARPT